MLELNSLHNIVNIMGDTAVHRGNGTRSRSRKTKCHITSSTGLKLGMPLVLYASINVKPEGPGGPRAYVGHLIVVFYH